MKPAALVLALLRTHTSDTTKAWGFILRGAALQNPVGGGCTLACAVSDTVYEITATAGGTDWYIPFHSGEARYCDVPAGQPNGTLVVTFPMNGCALEVRAHGGGVNRFYHDSDGRSLPAGPIAPKCRVNYQAMAGGNEQTLVKALRTPRVQNFEHTLICVKDNANWNVYQTAVVSAFQPDMVSLNRFQVKDYLPNPLATFAD